MSRVAGILGDKEGSERYASLRDERKKFFNDTYINPSDGRTLFSSFDPSRKGDIVDTQISYALPIVFCVSDDPRLAGHLVEAVCRRDTTDSGVLTPPCSLMTGFIGTAWISKALSEIGRPDLAYQLLCSEDYPSWLYPVKQGATTIWERLDSYTRERGFGVNNSMNSFNHYSFGSVADWLLTRSIGIQARPGIAPETVTIAPEPDTTGNLTYARGYMDLPEGRVESGWRIADNGDIVYELTVPAGIEATFIPYGGTPRLLGSGNHSIRVSKNS